MDLFTRVPRGRQLRADEEKLLQTATPFRVRAEGHELAAWSWGDGPTVLLQHGWSSRGSHLGAFVRPLLDAGFSVVTYDAPAHGVSPGRKTNGFEIARIVLELTRRLNGVEAIIAHSLGCSASGFAMRAGAPVKRAVFLNPPCEMESYADLFGDSLGFSPRAMHLMKRGFEAGSHNTWSDFEPVNLARGQHAPLLVISDRDDRKVPWRSGRSIAEAWPEGQFYRTTGLGHLRVLKAKETIERAVDFVQGDKAGRGDSRQDSMTLTCLSQS
jgi:pimeloyl-ACP methyl ester carboxylesterase